MSRVFLRSCASSRYRYVGPAEIAARDFTHSARRRITAQGDVIEWIEATQQSPDPDGVYTATFVVLDDRLWIADRHSEHVGCARGKDVLAAGEMRFRREKQSVLVEEVSNQSTGYCPRRASWQAVAAALDRAGIAHPGKYTLALQFRRCPKCQAKCIVKNEDFTCLMCGALLPERWNF